MKTIKRLLSVALIACLLVTVLVPAAFATETQTNNVLTYQFGHNGTTEGLAKETDSYSNYGVSLGGTTAGRSTYLCSSHNVTYQWNTQSFMFKFRTKTAAQTPANFSDKENRSWFAIQIDGVTPGTYEMAFTVATNDTTGNANVYVLDQTGFNTAIEPYMDKLNSKTAPLVLADNTAIYNALNSNNAVLGKGAISCVKNASSGKIGHVTFPKAGSNSYILLFESTGHTDETKTDYRVSVVSLTMTPKVASVTAGETTTYYDTTEAAVEAINAATSGTVTLLADITSATSISLDENVTLDLNGKTLNANVTGSGTVTDSSENSQGKIVGESAVQNVGAGKMALYDGATTRIVTCTVSALEAEAVTAEGAVSAVNFWYTITFDNEDVYQMIEDAADDAKFTIGAELTFGGTTKNAELKNTTVVSDWAGAMADRKAGDVYAFYVSVTGFENLAAGTTGDLSVKLWTKDSTNTKAYSEAVVYNIGG